MAESFFRAGFYSRAASQFGKDKDFFPCFLSSFWRYSTAQIVALRISISSRENTFISRLFATMRVRRDEYSIIPSVWRICGTL